MNRPLPLISVIVPTFNNAKTISQALDSLIVQTYPNIEIIIVDDGSTDNTLEVVKPYLDKYEIISYVKNTVNDPYRMNRLGVNINAGYHARNLGINHARGELVTFQDADDASLADRIEIQYRMLQNHDAVHCVVNYQDFNPELIGMKYGKPIPEEDILKQSEINRYLKNSPPVPRLLRDPHSYRKENIPPVRLLKRLARRFFLHEPTPYPCSGNTALVTREVVKKVQFRPLWEREWPSHKGRGADMDFNYHVAKRFKKSIAIDHPLYLWRRERV